MRKVLFSIFFSVLFIASVSAKTVDTGGKIYLSDNRQVNLDCSIQDPGVGMDEGQAQFRVRYADGTFTEWTTEQQYQKLVALTLDVVHGQSFNVQGRFSDSLGNWTEEPIEVVKSMELDNSGPSGGTIDIVVTVTITVN